MTAFGQPDLTTFGQFFSTEFGQTAFGQMWRVEEGSEWGSEGWRAQNFALSRRGFTRQPENSKRAHFRAPALQTPPKFHEKTSQEREERKKNVAGEGKKKSEILGGPGGGAVRGGGRRAVRGEEGKNVEHAQKMLNKPKNPHTTTTKRRKTPNQMQEHI